jgi:hypothetical protein
LKFIWLPTKYMWGQYDLVESVEIQPIEECMLGRVCC